MNVRFLLVPVLVLIVATSASAQDPMTKIDVRLRMQLRAEAAGDREAARLFGATDDPVLHVFLKGDPARLRAAVERHGGRLGAVAGDIATARIPRAALHALAGEDAVARVEGARPLARDNDVAAVSVGASRVWTMTDGGAAGYTGKGVIVGTIDTGIDFTHPDFRDRLDSMKSRIIAIWDQNTFGGPTPEGFDYGELWTREQIEASLADPLRGVVTHRDLQGHGTHVAGTAAGNGAAVGRFGGMAPDAEIIAVATRFQLSTAVFDAAAFIFGEASRRGRPAVINISLGFDSYPHDGNSLIDEGLDNLLDARAGRVVCASAGNSGMSMDHWGAQLVDSTQWTYLRIPSVPSTRSEIGRRTVPVSIRGIVRDADASRLWLAIGLDSIARTGSTLTPTTVMKTPWIRLDQLVASGSGSYTLRYRNATTAAIASLYGASLNTREITFQVMIADQIVDPFDSARPDPDGMDLFRIMVRGQGEMHLWRSEGTSVALASLSDPVGEDYRDWGSGYAVRSPGSARNVITVGAYNNLTTFRNHLGVTTMTSPAGGVDGALAIFSSAGPTLDGRLKPEIVAPGKGVISSLSTWAADQLRNQGLDSLIVEGGRHIAMSGTSMSTPVTVGSIALYLQRYPEATWRQVKEAITTTALRDTFTTTHGALPNAHWGHGKLDIYRAILGSSSAPTTRSTPDARLTLRPNVATDHVSIDVVPSGAGRVTIALFDALGRELRTLLDEQLREDRTLSADCSTLPAGVYFVRMTTDGASVVAPVTVMR